MNPRGYLEHLDLLASTSQCLLPGINYRLGIDRIWGSYTEIFKTEYCIWLKLFNKYIYLNVNEILLSKNNTATTTKAANPLT